MPAEQALLAAMRAEAARLRGMTEAIMDGVGSRLHPNDAARAVLVQITVADSLERIVRAVEPSGGEGGV